MYIRSRNIANLSDIEGSFKTIAALNKHLKYWGLSATENARMGILTIIKVTKCNILAYGELDIISDYDNFELGILYKEGNSYIIKAIKIEST